MKKTAIFFSLSMVFLVFSASSVPAQDTGASSQMDKQAENSPCACGCGMPGCMCGPGGCGMHGMGGGYMGMGGPGKCGMGPGMRYGMGRGMGPGAGAGVYGKAGLDATKDLRRELHMKKFEHFEAMRDPGISDEEILKLEEEIRILNIKIRRKAMQ